MDYTLSDAYTTDAGTGNRMHQQSAAVPTAVSDKDMNGVIWSLMEVVKAAGLAGAQFDKTVPATYQKLLTALRSAGLFVTPAQFDATTKAATTSFVQRALGSHSASYTFSAATTLSNVHAGGVIRFGSGGYTVTLPLVGSFNDAADLVLMNTGISNITIACQGADTLSTSGNSITSLVLGVGDTLCLSKSSGASQWTAIGGSAQLGSAAVFSSSLSSNGYQKLPGGLIVQWGTCTGTAGGSAVSFPIAFPNGCLSLATRNPYAADGALTAIETSTPTTSGFTAYGLVGTAGATVTTTYMAIGF